MYEVLRPLYCIPSSARALHYTLDKFMTGEGFVRSTFEESVWVREPTDKCKHHILMSAHIDNTLIFCKDLGVLQQFKQELLTLFEGTDEGEVCEYLGCEVVCDCCAGTLLLKQGSYIQRILATHRMQDCNPVKTPLEPGARLSHKDSPAVPNP